MGTAIEFVDRQNFKQRLPYLHDGKSASVILVPKLICFLFPKLSTN